MTEKDIYIVIEEYHEEYTTEFQTLGEARAYVKKMKNNPTNRSSFRICKLIEEF